MDGEEILEPTAIVSQAELPEDVREQQASQRRELALLKWRMREDFRLRFQDPKSFSRLTMLD